MQSAQDSTATSFQEDRPGTPPRPPYSPVTPVFAHLDPVASNDATIIPPPLLPSPTSKVVPESTTSYRAPPPPAAPPVFKPEPPPVPISESENPDAIALRSAISILQLQKQQSLRDIQTLDRLKEAAAADPEGFARELAAGRLRTEDRGAIIQFSDNDAMETEENAQEDQKHAEGNQPSASKFGSIPSPQNVVRMPPINWAKYKVMGDSLDRMHEEQLRRPSSGEPRREPAAEHVLASPYRPLVDHLGTPARLARPSKAKKP
ncbi:hypothetical protein N7462_000759 [Penicillium macrosclerotiorum]|uniref:uncharacterized protein n=1 Tax=Penicillium macrosclerotiorum TaxID=303699 RepID=UPI0025492C16|nr:uncharacterized protein N7462_000759 [Penicillium macrosclerotiorum]KAJ5698754.1 hypothetical protein N7462_000759 [Penicillium macrosclerotiorum]